MKCLLILLCVLSTSIQAAEPKPNIILILSDDQGFTDYGFMGHEIVQTPNIDRLAAQSLLYTRGYVMPVCSPSLACLLTGRLPHQHGITGNDLSPEAIAAEHAKGKGDRSPLSHRLLSNSVILPKALSEVGYLTYQTGKLWNVTAKEVGFTDGMTSKEGRHGGDGLDIGRKTMKPMFDFMADARSQNKPFFVWYAPLLPHAPHNSPEEYLAKYKGKGLSTNAEKYYAMCEWFDHTCGEIDEFLTERNLADNTILIYMADNGWDKENKGKGGRAKLSPYELGIRTPMFVRWPGKVKPQRDDETLASIVDFVPTVMKIAGLEVPSDMPGLDLLDRAAMTARKTVFVESYTHDIADLARPEKSLVAQVVINGWSKLLIPGTVGPDKSFTSGPKKVELFDLKVDPLETKDLAEEQPDLVERLTALQQAAWNKQ